MEHIAGLVCHKVDHLRVPAIFSRNFMYDQKGFWGFPERVSFPVEELWMPEEESLLPAHEKLSFLQNWLYFAFADEVTSRIVDDSPITEDAISCCQARRRATLCCREHIPVVRNGCLDGVG